MARTPIVPDLKEDWVADMAITPNGEAYSDEKLGWNYIQKKINSIINFINDMDDDVGNKLSFEIVTSFPPVATANEHTIYLMRDPDVADDDDPSAYMARYVANGKYRDLGKKIPFASTTVAGLVKVDGVTISIDSNGVISTSITVDDALDSTSENPVQNKVLKAALDSKMDTGDVPYGLPVGPVRFRRKIVSATTVTLHWKDPDDSYVEGQPLSIWASTTIVKKYGSVPTSVTDGTVVVTTTQRDQYYTNGYVDNQTDGDNWYYRAFPKSTSKLYSDSRLNDFQYWYCGVVFDNTIADPAQKVTPLAGTDNYYSGQPFMNKTTLQFDWAGWEKKENVPFMPRPCMIKQDLTVDYYLNPDNELQKEDGTPSDVTNTAYAGNAMVEWPLMWYKVTKSGHTAIIELCSEQKDSGFVRYAYSTKDGSYLNHKYTPIYEGSIINGIMRSMSTNSRPTANTNMDAEMNAAYANGDGHSVTRAETEMLMKIVFLIFFRHTNGNVVLGNSPGSQSALTLSCGAGNGKGPFYGTDSGVTKFFWMENWWGHRWRRFVGMTTLTNREYYVKRTWGNTDDGSTTTAFNTTGSGYIPTGIFQPNASSTYIQEISLDFDTFGYPTLNGGSATTYMCDGYWSGANPCGPYGGGCVGSGLLAGPFCLACNDAPSISDWADGASLEI